MADDQGKTEEVIILNAKGTSPFYYAKAAMATEADLFKIWVVSSKDL